MPTKHPYSKMTCQKMEGMGRDFWKVEYLNPFHIIKERTDLRVFRDRVMKFCEYCKSDDLTLELIQQHISALSDIGNVTQNQNYYAGQKNDCFHFFDYLVICPVKGIVAIQSTGANGHSEHRRKILRNEHALRWVSWAKIELWSWQKKPQKPGSKRLIWKARTEEITIDMFTEQAKKDKAKSINPDDLACYGY